jgi:hypothetical protein
MQITTLTVIPFELVDIFLPMKNWRGVIVRMQQAAPMMALTPSFWYSRYMSTPIWTTHRQLFTAMPPKQHTRAIYSYCEMMTV